MHKASPKKHAGVLSYISTGVGYNTYAPEAYKQKWSSYDLDSKAVLGLKILDKLGTPVIVKTPWLYR